MNELSSQENEVLGVFRRITGFFGNKPKPNTSRRYDGIWRSIQAQGSDLTLDDISLGIKGLAEKGFLRLDEERSIAHLTDKGYELISQV